MFGVDQESAGGDDGDAAMEDSDDAASDNTEPAGQNMAALLDIVSISDEQALTRQSQTADFAPGLQ